MVPAATYRSQILVAVCALMSLKFHFSRSQTAKKKEKEKTEIIELTHEMD